MVGELSAWLAEATVAGTAAIVLVLLLRRPLRAAFGAGAAYAAWSLVPAVLLASLLPAAVEPMAPRMVAVVAAGVAGMPTMAAAPAFDYRTLGLLFWGLGLLLTGWLLVRQQHRFLRGLGALRHRADGMLESESVAGLPAVIGWRSQIVLPRDFEQRYDAHERQLVLCHEGVHRRRGDLHASALVAALRCLFWFNPVLHYGAGRFRHDQELACDAAVLRRYPQSRRAYGDALLKTQLADRPLPLGCHWFGSHPLKERIAMLKRPSPHRLRGFTGLVLAALLSLAAGWTVWAAQPPAPSADGLQLQMTLTLNGGGEHVETATMLPGEPKAFTYTQDGQRWDMTLTLKPMDEGQVHIAAEILRDGASQGSPRLVTKLGTSAAIGIGERFPDRFEGIQIEMLVTGGEPAGQPAELTEGLTGPVPVYPAAQVAAGEGGTVMLRVLVGKDGRPVRSEFEPHGSTVPPDSPLVASARETSMKWTFNAGTQDGKPVEGWVAVPVRFEPRKSAAGT
jgi:bla regulator protein BlaR1